MKESLNGKTTYGFSIVEIILSITIFSLFVTAFAGSFLYAEESSAVSGNHDRGLFIAYEGLEAVRSIRDNDFALLVDGTFGLSHVSGQWDFSGSSDTQNGYTRSIEIEQIDTNIKQITSQVSWDQNAQRTGNITLVSYLSNWLEEQVLSGLVFDTTNINLSAGDTRLSGIEITNNTSTAIQITSITVTWSGSDADNVRRINIGNNPREYTCFFNSILSFFCPGSGDEIPISYTIVAGQTVEITEMRFWDSFAGATFDILLKSSLGDEYLLENVSI